MRVAALYDIHGNLPALQAVLNEVRSASVDQIVIGGDVLPGPMPRETLDCLCGLDRPVQYIRGNGDREVLARRAGTETDWYRTAQDQWREPVRWSAEQLRDDDIHWMAGWPATCRLEIPGLGRVLFCHATPRNDTDVFTRLTSEERLLPIFENADADLVVCGHTHMQFDRRIGPVSVVNAGSVGMPYGEPGADWLLLGPDVELRRTAYDLEKAAFLIRGTAYPQAAAFAEQHVLRPPTAEAILAAFSKLEMQ